jgi:hypothetical protein
MVHDVFLWLNSNRNYQEGLRLLLQHATPARHDLILLQAGENSFSKKKLFEMLSPLAKERAKKAELNETPKRTFNRYQRKDIDALPEDLQALWSRNKLLYGILDELRGQIRSANYTKTGALKLRVDKKRNYTLAHKVMACHEEIRSNYERIDHYVNTGDYLPGTKPMDEEAQVLFWLDGNLVQATNYVSKNRTLKVRPNEQRYQDSLQLINNVKAYVARKRNSNS